MTHARGGRRQPRQPLRRAGRKPGSATIKRCRRYCGRGRTSSILCQPIEPSRTISMCGATTASPSSGSTPWNCRSAATSAERRLAGFTGSSSGLKHDSWRSGMTTSIVQLEVPGATAVTATEDTLTADLTDGRTISVPLAWYPRLLHATPEERDTRCSRLRPALGTLRRRPPHPLARPRRGHQRRGTARGQTFGGGRLVIPPLAGGEARRPPADARRAAPPRPRAAGPLKPAAPEAGTQPNAT